MAYDDVPAIDWGDGYVNTLEFAYPLDNVTSWSEPSPGSDTRRVSSGSVDSWITGWDYYLQGDARWIPISDTANPSATGWDGPTGWRAFLEWMALGHAARFRHDKNLAAYVEVVLVDIPHGPAALEPADGSRRLTIKLRRVDAQPFTGY